jgi:hypothetical protein
MTAANDDDDLFIEALRDDLPSAADEARVRARLLGAGLVVGGVAVSSSVAASGGAAGGIASSGIASGGAAGGGGIGTGALVANAGAKVGVLAKLALLPASAKIGVAAVALAAVSTPLVVSELERVQRQPAASVSSVAPAAPVSSGAPSAAPARSAPQPVATTVPPLDGVAQAPAMAAPSTVTAPSTAPHASPSDAARVEGQGNRALAARAPVEPRRARSSAATTAIVTPAAVTAAAASAAAPAGATSPAIESVAALPPEAGQPAVSRLGDEAELMERALSALAAHDFDHARYWLIEHARRFPDGLLQHERARIRERLEREYSNK